MKVSDVFPGKYLKAADLNGKQVKVIIAEYTMESIGDETLPLIHFRGAEKGFILNKTNLNSIAEIHGDETDDWIGKAIAIFPTQTDFNGKAVPCIRVALPTVSTVSAPAAPAVTPNGLSNTAVGELSEPTPPTNKPIPVGTVTDDEIPF